MKSTDASAINENLAFAEGQRHYAAAKIDELEEVTKNLLPELLELLGLKEHAKQICNLFPGKERNYEAQSIKARFDGVLEILEGADELLAKRGVGDLFSGMEKANGSVVATYQAHGRTALVCFEAELRHPGYGELEAAAKYAVACAADAAIVAESQIQVFDAQYKRACTHRERAQTAAKAWGALSAKLEIEEDTDATA